MLFKFLENFLWIDYYFHYLLLFLLGWLANSVYLKRYDDVIILLGPNIGTRIIEFILFSIFLILYVLYADIWLFQFFNCNLREKPYYAVTKYYTEIFLINTSVNDYCQPLFTNNLTLFKDINIYNNLTVIENLITNWDKSKIKEINYLTLWKYLYFIDSCGKFFCGYAGLFLWPFDYIVVRPWGLRPYWLPICQFLRQFWWWPF
jgi:hypothetical protein